MSRRLVTDAKIVLERAGYSLHETKSAIMTGMKCGQETGYLYIENGSVDNEEVIKLLKVKGFDKNGYPIR